jgi:hypothetical protein
MIRIERQRFTIELHQGSLAVRTRRRHFLIAFAIQLTRHACIQFGDRIFWLR